jgi:nitronate monooxygenase
MPIQTPVMRLLGIEQPILLAPMGMVSGGALAAAVSHAGGLGILGGGYGDGAWLTRECDAAGNAPIGIGFITWSLAKQPQLLDQALERAPRCIFLSFGDLRPFAPKVAAAGIPLIAQVQSVAQAREAVDHGASIIVAQGSEAGGHGAGRSTLPLVPAVVDALGDVPVVAAGGIADGRGLAAALMLGAQAVLCGSLFYASTEALAHPNAKKTLTAASGDHTLRSSVFDIARGYDWPQPWNMRTLDNDFSRRWADDTDGLKASITSESARFAAARDAGDFTTAVVIAGEAADLIREIRPAAQIVADMVAEAEALLAKPPYYQR